MSTRGIPPTQSCSNFIKDQIRYRMMCSIHVNGFCVTIRFIIHLDIKTPWVLEPGCESFAVSNFG